MNTFTVYMHVCPNGKRYIGITGKDPKKRWNGGSGYCHNREFYKDIRKYGWGSIKHVLMLKNVSKEKAEHWEKELIKRYDTMDPDKGYNHNGGGHYHGEISEAVREKLRKTSRLQPGTKCKCVETGEEYVSISAAARKLGVHRSSIERSCSTKGRIAAKGFHFVYGDTMRDINTQEVLKESQHWDWTWEW